jgi:hypothetical protein
MTTLLLFRKAMIEDWVVMVMTRQMTSISTFSLQHLAHALQIEY